MLTDARGGSAITRPASLLGLSPTNGATRSQPSSVRTPWVAVRYSCPRTVAPASRSPRFANATSVLAWRFVAGSDAKFSVAATPSGAVRRAECAPRRRTQAARR